MPLPQSVVSVWTLMLHTSMRSGIDDAIAYRKQANGTFKTNRTALLAKRNRISGEIREGSHDPTGVREREMVDQRIRCDSDWVEQGVQNLSTVPVTLKMWPGEPMS